MTHRAMCVVLLVIAGHTPSAGSVPDKLAEGFRHPPHAARPWVWWHWMDGNISADGARRDLQWMRRAGIGGVQLFEGGLGTPKVVPRRLTYMSEPWKAAFKASAVEAHRLGLDLGIATSPGWSATGGPWVAPVDSMKKLVWTRIYVSADNRGDSIRLPRPPGLAGPYQDIPLSDGGFGAARTPILYRDARVLAFPMPQEFAPPQSLITTSDRTIDAHHFVSLDFGTPLALRAEADGKAWVRYQFERDITIRSITVGLPERTGFGAPKPSVATLEASRDGQTWHVVTVLAPTGSPVRIASFPATSARYFRLLLERDPQPGFMEQLSFAPGAVRPNFGPPAAAFMLSQITLGQEALVDHAAEKAGFATVPDYDAVPTPSASGVDPAKVVDLTDRLHSDGTLDWRPPSGTWTVLRLGWSPTGHRNGPAPAEATGLEVDKLDPARVSAYLDHYLGLYRSALGSDMRLLKGLLSDSIEAGPQNWTEGLPAAFTRLRGYDPTPYLPALTGTIIGDASRTDRFLWDWRKTISDLYVQAHYGSIAAIARRDHLTYYAEALEDHRPQLGDDMAMRAVADVPMAAMWTLDADASPKPTYLADIRGAVSVADLYGRSIIAAESLTAFGHPYAYAPADLKRTVDLEFALGINRIMIHTSPHQPLRDAPPGIALAPFLGQYFSRNETWADMARGWTDYIARSSFLLQQGHKVADVALFFGEEAPLTARYGDRAIEGPPDGHDFDFVNAEALQSRLSVAPDGSLVTPGGMRYAVLQLSGSSRSMTLATVRRLHALVAAGATIVGDRPVASPSLGDDERDMCAAVDALWGEEGSESKLRKVGRGEIYAAGQIRQALTDHGIQPDWRWSATRDDHSPLVTHRSMPDTDIYFVTNQQSHAVSGVIDLRVSGREVELWRADIGSRVPVAYWREGERTALPLSLRAGEAVFIVLRHLVHNGRRVLPKEVERVIAIPHTNWTLTFQPGRGAPIGPHSTEFGAWNENADPRIRYFSGRGVYRTKWWISLPRGLHGQRLVLDLGRVGDVARVSINGRPAGIVWHPPYRLIVSNFLRNGKNRITIEVANLWVNRLIGDTQLGHGKIAHVYGQTYRADATLRFSGLSEKPKLIMISRLGSSVH